MSASDPTASSWNEPGASLTGAFPPVRKSAATSQDAQALTRTAQIVETLRVEIASGVLPHGTRLQQSDLAERFQTSTTPVREALRQLEAEGLVFGRPHHGVAVASPDGDQIKSMYVVLRLLEPYAARRAASRMTRRDFAQARRLNEAFAEALMLGDGPTAWRLDEQFHFTIYDRCGLSTLAQEIRRLWAAFPWAGIHAPRTALESPAREHTEMLDALVKGDDPLTQRLFEHHVLSGFQSLVEHLDGDVESDPFQLDSLD